MSATAETPPASRPLTASGPEKIVFVGGAPRSGTTVAHALICSADGVGPYHPEASFLRGLLPAWRNGKVAWDSHTKAFFDDMEAFRLHMRATVDLSLLHLWDVLERPAILSLKDPHLTPFFRDLRELYPDIGYFVTTCRNPLDVVRSRQEVHEKGQARPFSDADAAAIAREYVAYYTSVLQTNFNGRHFMFRYEDLNTDRVRAGLAGFIGVDHFNVDRMWSSSKPVEQGGDWGSPKYDGPIVLEPRLSPLAEPWATQVREICAPIMARVGYS